MTNPERYHILDEIGRGGMGVVYRARDAQLGRDVALKLLPAVLAQEENALRRFQLEAQIIAQLEHPHIVPIYDTGIRDNQPFIVMRLLRGGSLQDKLKKGQIAPDLLWQLLRQIGRALDATHAQHIIHRDIKPTNILFDEQGQAYIADFGIAKALDATTQYTGNTIVGSPMYMGPEQFTGQNLSGRTDQYALAVVVFEALAGQLPFQGNTIKLMHDHLNQRPPAIYHLNANLSPALDAVLQRALAKEPQERYETIGAFVEALQKATATQPIPAIPLPPTPEKLPNLTTTTSQKLQLFYRQGLEAIERQQWPAAAEAFRQVLSIDPNHTNAKARYREVQDKLEPNPVAEHTRYVPPPQATPQPVASKIVKGAGGTVAAPTAVTARWANKWVIGGGAIFLMALLLWAIIGGGTAEDPPAATATSTSTTVTTNEEGLAPTPPQEESPITAELPPTPTPIDVIEVATLDFAANVYGTSNYELLSSTELQITQGDLVVEGTGTPVTIQNRFKANVQLSGNGLVGMRYDTGNQQFTVHCLGGTCVVRGDVSGEVQLRVGQAVTVGSNGTPGTLFAAQNELFTFAAIVPTPTPTSTPTHTPAPTATFTSTPRPTNTPTFPTQAPPTQVPPLPITEVPPTEVPVTEVPPTEVPPCVDDPLTIINECE